jgi:class 3 adenylate cyclase
MTVGRYLKNVRTGNDRSVVVPAGTSAERPAEPIFGSFRFNISTGRLEVYNGSAFDQLSIAGLTNVIVDEFIGDGSTVVFGSLTNRVDNETDILVFIGGVYQIPSTNYTNDGSYDITFTTAPPGGVTINVLHNINSTAV